MIAKKAHTVLSIICKMDILMSIYGSRVQKTIICPEDHKKVEPYILHNSNLYRMVEVRTKIPMLHEAIQWKWMSYHSICMLKLQKRRARKYFHLSLHKSNCTFLTTLKHELKNRDIPIRKDKNHMSLHVLHNLN